ncbi:hypothetical protein KIW84_012247 [Lathyrus oleraceus]|uniref:Uncharacterized protein n=1 Tax=Pisum sativum TaxID=3888 RepID=A0A9D5BH64_PEA|nr:hypothetical protein KIW84_012247 [Pisum sativum]
MKMWTTLSSAFCPDRAFYLIPHSSNFGLLYALLMPAHSDGPLLCVVSKNASLSAETIVTVLATLRNMTEPVRVIPKALSIMIRLKFSLTVSITCQLDEEINKDVGENNFKQCSTVEIQDDNLIWDQAGTGNNNFVDQLVLENQHFYMQYLERFIRFLGTTMTGRKSDALGLEWQCKLSRLIG